MGLRVSRHAILRYQERVDAVSDDVASAALQSEAIVLAAKFGAPYVRLPTGQRVALDGWTVVTVYPKDTPRGRFHPLRVTRSGPR